RLIKTGKTARYIGKTADIFGRSENRLGLDKVMIGPGHVTLVKEQPAKIVISESQLNRIAFLPCEGYRPAVIIERGFIIPLVGHGYSDKTQRFRESLVQRKLSANFISQFTIVYGAVGIG